jgi:hypothetical protein
LGYNAIATASNTITLGNSSIATLFCQVTSITGISDERRKKDIARLGLGLDFIMKLAPVSYRYNNGDDTLRYGFIAQEVEKALPGPADGLALVAQAQDEERTYHLAYAEFIAPLVKAVQEQQRIIESLTSRLAAAGL